ncbi:MAG TPA: hypothetical protein DDX04_13325 [Massilia sp.]|nr:hypothetical protein [Massilia sp.]
MTFPASLQTCCRSPAHACMRASLPQAQDAGGTGYDYRWNKKKRLQSRQAPIDSHLPRRVFTGVREMR